MQLSLSSRVYKVTFEGPYTSNGEVDVNSIVENHTISTEQLRMSPSLKGPVS